MSDWKALAEKELRGRSLSDLDWETLEGIAVKPLYTEDDTDGLAHLGNTPGYAPFTRGVKATMYAGRPWTIRQYAGLLDGRRIERFLSQGPGRRAAGCVRGLRSGDPSGL